MYDVELRECPICHLDCEEIDMTNGICNDCLEYFHEIDKYTTEFERIHGNEYDWSDYGSDN